MGDYSRRLTIVVSAAAAAAINGRVKADIDPPGGAWLDVPLSATGNAPATHYWASAQLTPQLEDRLRQWWQAQGAAVRNNIRLFDGHAQTPEEVLTAVGLKRVESGS